MRHAAILLGPLAILLVVALLPRVPIVPGAAFCIIGLMVLGKTYREE